MIASIRIFLCGALALADVSPARALDISPAPDSIVLQDGAEIKGLIVRNVRGDITIQTPTGEESYTRAEISRIRDVPGEGHYLTRVERPGSLPPWRTLVNDLRHNDSIESLEQIPATVIDNGEFKNVPYLSFRINKAIELNIYGDPENPAGIEIGIYGSKQGNKKLRRICREFLVSYLNSRDEIEAVYQLNEKGGLRHVGDMAIEYTPANAPDAYGAWWLSAYNRKTLAATRLTDREYDQLTRPVDSVLDGKGRVRDDAWTSADTAASLRLQKSGGKDSARLFVRGFYRDKDGNFHLTTAQ